MAKGNHSFTEQEIRKRFGAIIGHTVAEVDTAGVLTASAASRNKGRIGAVIEQSVLEENKENNLEGEHKEEIPL